MKLLSLRRKFIFTGSLLGLESALMLLGSLTALAYNPSLGQTSPYAPNSTPDGAHVFLLRISEVQGVQRNVKLSAYYQNQANGSSITISPSANTGSASVCSASTATLASNVAQRYITVTISDAGQNGTNQRVYHISRADACREKSGSNTQGQDPTNAFYAQYPVPNTARVDPQTQLYKLDITIEYNAAIPRPTSGSDDDLTQQRFVVKSQGGNSRIGQLGGSGRAFPIVVDWGKRNDYYAGRIEVPFGLPCTTNNSQIARVGVYDADNGTVFGSRLVRFGILKKIGTNPWEAVNLTNRSNARPITTERIEGVDVEVLTPRDGSTELSDAQINMDPNVKYKMVVMGIAPRNTIDIKIPYDSIFGDINCVSEAPPTGALISAVCTASGGQTITFTTSDPNGATQGRIKVGSNYVSAFMADGQQSVTLSAGQSGMNFRTQTYPIQVEARDKLSDGSYAPGVTQVASGQTTQCPVTPSAGSVTPSTNIDAQVEVGGTVTGTTSYSSTFVMPTSPKSHGFDTTQYRGPFMSYTSRIWHDDGSETYTGPTTDKENNRDDQTRRTIGSPATEATLSSWAVTSELDPIANPRFKICVSLQITEAYYEYQTRPVMQTGVPPTWNAGLWPATWQRANINFAAFPDPPVKCTVIQRYPDMKVFEGDIKVGGVFKNGLSACTRDINPLTNHGIFGHPHAISPSTRGSLSQYAALAAGPVSNFGSNGFLSSHALSQELTFGRVSGRLGEFYGSASPVTTSCFDSVFDSYPNTDVPATNIGGGQVDVSAAQDGVAKFEFSGSGGTLNILGGSLQPNTRRIIRVSGGDASSLVKISSDITYAPNITTMYQIPQFILLVDSDAQIQIDSGVKTITGLYATRGSFATCAQFTPAVPNIHLAAGSDCREALTVNGAIIAGKRLLPYRTNAVTDNYDAPAEIIRLRGDVLIGDYAAKQQTGNFTTIGQLELPPRF